MKKDLLDFAFELLKYGGCILLMFLAVILFFEFLETTGFIYIGNS